MPFRFADGQLNVMSMTSFAPGGFSTAHLGQIYEVLPTLGRLFEVFAQRRTAVVLLETYLGRRTGGRVLNGLVKHGDGEHIECVVWFSDLRESTALSISMGREAYLAYLNAYFNCVAGAILENGGEVLRFIGDAALAIFPIGREGPRAACRQALAAALEALARMDKANASRGRPLRFGIGLHLGDVLYGNIGTPSRIEFTVIGAAANEAARIEALCKELETPLIASEAVARHLSAALRPLGRHRLRGVAEPMALFTPAKRT
jgi:adenylate cyclase